MQLKLKKKSIFIDKIFNINSLFTVEEVPSDQNFISKTGYLKRVKTHYYGRFKDKKPRWVSKKSF